MQFTVGAVVNRTISVLSRNFGTFFVLALLLMGIPALVLSLLAGDPAQAQFSALEVVGSIVSIAVAALLQGAIAHGTVVDYDGGKISIGEGISIALKYALPLIAISFIFAIAVMLGFVLLIVPGVILILMWMVSAPACVVENTGVFRSFGRSSELTKGQRWKLFLLSLIVLALLTVSLLIMALIFFGLFWAGLPAASSAFLEAIFSALIGTLMYTATAAIYVELRRLKEGAGPEETAKVFD